MANLSAAACVRALGLFPESPTQMVASIRCLVPDMPTAADLQPWLERIDANLWYTNRGPLVREFEHEIVGLVDPEGSAGCVTLASGMAALEVGLRALGVGTGHRVLMPALTFPATAQAVVRCGAEPVFADVCPRRWVLTPELARAALAQTRIDAVIPVAAFGCALPEHEWDEWSRSARVPVLVDAAAALGQQRVGRVAHWAFSMHATKPFGVGEGGLFVSANHDLVQRVRRLSNFGFEQRIVHAADGTNAKLSEYAAAVGLAQLRRWPALRSRRRRLFDSYRRKLAQTPGVALQAELPDAPATLCVQLPLAAEPAAHYLADRGIETRRWYLPPLTRHPPFAGALTIGAGGGRQLPVTDMLAERLLGLPFHTRLAEEDVARVVAALGGALRELRL